jgi:hypothetical protein
MLSLLTDTFQDLSTSTDLRQRPADTLKAYALRTTQGYNIQALLAALTDCGL